MNGKMFKEIYVIIFSVYGVFVVFLINKLKFLLLIIICGNKLLNKRVISIINVKLFVRKVNIFLCLNILILVMIVKIIIVNVKIKVIVKFFL